MAFRLMCITAHPDDESAGFGGALLMARASGVATSVVCLTEGGAGSYRESGQTDAELAAMRREEFAAASSLLGVRDATLLTYPDGGLYREAFEPMVGELVRHIRRVRPHVVLTFGAEGGPNLHRDHTVASLAATAAFHSAGRSGFYPEQLAAQPGSSPRQNLTAWAPQKLYYAATRFVLTRDEEAARAATRTPASLTLELSDWKDRKIEAFLKHSSQRGVYERVQSQIKDAMNEEHYLLVAARTPVSPDEALFAGVTGD